MNTISMKVILLALSLGSVTHAAFSQDYAVTIKGDTLKGKAKLFNVGEKKVQIAQDKKKQNIPLLQVRIASIAGEFYKPVKGPQGYAFMKLMKEGYLSLYSFQLENQTTFDGLFLVKKDGTSLEVPNLTFRKSLKKFLEDCSSTVAKLEAGEFSKGEIAAVVDDYNACVDTKTVTYPQPQQTQQAPPPASPTNTAWQTLHDKVSSLEEFEGKSDALEMITEINNKLARGEKVPNFMITGLKASLANQPVTAELEAALLEIR